MNNKYKIISTISLIGAITITILLVFKVINYKSSSESLEVNLTDLTYTSGDIKSYEISDFNTFLTDYNNGTLPKIYITKFLFDGVSMYKPYDLDDFIESGNETEVDVLEITTININTTGSIKLSGELKGGMIAVNTNNVTKDINLLLNGVNIDTDSKKVPVIYVYNKDINYTNSKVTINALNNTNNYLEGGKLKKVSLIPNDKLTDYTSKYNSDNKNNYEKYTNYYGIYSENEINNILFATVTADDEDLSDGDPYYFYKASGAISSDIDLYFEGEGYLEVTSKNKEGIETKGNLSFQGGSGDYVINAEDDCLNTTTDNKENSNARNNLTIDVNSLKAIVSNDADEGDAIDSNGELIINGGIIMAIAKPGGDAGIDSENGTYINGGTIIATGDMYDKINESSNQRFIVLSFGNRPIENDIITLLDSSDNVVFAYQTDRTYSNLVYSSSILTDATYTLYKNGTINGTLENGLYNNVTSYEKGTQLAYSSNTGNLGGRQQGMPSSNIINDNNPKEKPSNDNAQGNIPKERPNDSDNMLPPDQNERPSSEMPNNNAAATNKDFTLNGIANLFSGIATYQE